PAEEAEERHRRHLPVPVASRVDQVREVGGESTGDEGMGAGPRDEEQRQSQRRDEQAETEWPELRQRLEIEAVRVANVRRASPVLEPVLLECPGAGAQSGARLPVAAGRPP